MSLVDLGKRLLEAAKRGETDEVRTLMSNGAPFTTDWLGTSPLHFSAQYGHVSTAEVLLRAGISRDARTKVDRTPLHVAAQEGHVDIVNILLQHAADIDAKDMLKMTPLHWATEKGHLDVIEVLLKSGADMSCENKFEKTPLDIAIMNGRPDIVQTIQMAQVGHQTHTAITNLEPQETVTVETTEVDGPDAIIDGSDQMSIETHANLTADNDGSNLLLHNLENVKGDNADDSAEEGNSTSVLATLAALAEATAQNTTTAGSNTSDAINWLESQGITMISTSDGNIITSAVESGQTITLTEAGKIALNIIKQQGLDPDDGVLQGVTSVKDEDGNVTYVTATGAESLDGTDDLQMQDVASNSIIIQEVCGSDEPVAKRVKLEEDEQVESTEIDVDAMLQKNGSGDATNLIDDESDQDKLRRELEEIKKQAEAFKEQLKQKDKDLEEYKKALGEISDKSDSEK